MNMIAAYRYIRALGLSSLDHEREIVEELTRHNRLELPFGAEHSSADIHTLLRYDRHINSLYIRGVHKNLDLSDTNISIIGVDSDPKHIVFPAGLRELTVAASRTDAPIVIPRLPDGLEELHVAGNSTIVLPKLPDTIVGLTMSGILRDLPSRWPTSLRRLYLFGQIHCSMPPIPPVLELLELPKCADFDNSLLPGDASMWSAEVILGRAKYRKIGHTR